MKKEITDWILDISLLDLADIRPGWEWLIPPDHQIFMVTKCGDLFTEGPQGSIHWLQTGVGQLKKIADNRLQFLEEAQLKENQDEWFLAKLISIFEIRNIVLKSNEVHSMKQPLILGGEVDADNFAPTNISIHFYLSGQLCEKVKKLPPGTRIRSVSLSDSPETKPEISRKWWKFW